MTLQDHEFGTSEDYPDYLAVTMEDGRVRRPALGTNEAEQAMRDWNRASEEIMRHQRLEFPPPLSVAYSLPSHAIAALLHAQKGKNGDLFLRPGVRDLDAGQVLFSAGCVEAGGSCLGGFGLKVRRAILDAQKEGIW